MATDAIAIREAPRPVVGYGWQETTDLGSLLAKSGYFQDARDMAQAVVKVLAGRELGFGPVASMTGIYIVKGRVTLSANLMAAAVKKGGKYNYRVVELSDTACKIDFYEGKEKIGESGFTMEDARVAGLVNENYKKFARNMLFARAMSNGAKWYCADVFSGPVYTPDELGAAIDMETGEMLARPKDEVIAPAPKPEPPKPEPVATGGPSYEPFGAITMVTKLGGGAGFDPAALEKYFGAGIRSKTKLDEMKAKEADLFREGYDRLHRDYEAWQAGQS